MKIIFFGTPQFAKIILSSLIENKNFDIVCVVTNPDKLIGRKKILTPSPVKQLAIENNIEILQPAKLKDADFINRLKEISADLFVVASYGKIIPKEVLDIPKNGCINIHGSMLPEYRGASPIQFALLDGEKETGITIMLMDEGMDTGPILSQEKIKIEESDIFSTLSEKMARLGARMLEKTLPDWIGGKIKPIKQDDSKATYTRLFKPEDYEIDFNKTAEEIKNKIRALYPDAYAELRIKNYESRIKVLEVKKIKEIVGEEIKKTGNLFVFDKKLFVKCKTGYVELLKLQPAGKNIMSGKDFLNGHKEIPTITL